MKLVTAAVVLTGLVACTRSTAHDAPAPDAPAAAAPPAAAPAADRAAPSGGSFTATDGKEVEVASLYQGHCAVLTFYRGFF